MAVSSPTYVIQMIVGPEVVKVGNYEAEGQYVIDFTELHKYGLLIGVKDMTSEIVVRQNVQHTLGGYYVDRWNMSPEQFQVTIQGGMDDANDDTYIKAPLESKDKTMSFSELINLFAQVWASGGSNVKLRLYDFISRPHVVVRNAAIGRIIPRVSTSDQNLVSYTINLVLLDFITSGEQLIGPSERAGF